MKWSRWRNNVLGEGKATENIIRHLEEKTKRKPIASDVRPPKTGVQSKREGGDKPRRGVIKTSSVRRGGFDFVTSFVRREDSRREYRRD